MISFFRVIKFALQDMVRNMSLSLMTVVILVLMLLSVNTLVVVKTITGEAVRTVKDQIDVSLYFASDVEQEQVDELTSFIESFPEVTEIVYFDSNEVLNDFKSSHQERDYVIDALDEIVQNPFGPTLVVKTREPNDYQKVIEAVSIPEYADVIEAKTFGDTQEYIRRIDVITQQVEGFVLMLTGLFAVIAFFVIFNTVRVAIYTQREEIGIKKLVGATNWFVRGPYIVESIVFSAVAVAITLTAVYMAVQVIDPYVAVMLETEGLLTAFYDQNMMQQVLMQFGVVLALTITTSGLAMRRYLRR
ncbi:MAG: FtsX-like permease family protein [Candidatus Magasanikbacteria bacterium]|jgi:cell division transport system permease protein|nr:FtsX-like permease family protein [Candidatus Magasanikbacteria bacterium]